MAHFGYYIPADNSLTRDNNPKWLKNQANLETQLKDSYALLKGSLIDHIPDMRDIKALHFALNNIC